MIQEDEEEVLVCNLVYTLLKYFQAFLPTHSFCANHQSCTFSTHIVPKFLHHPPYWQVILVYTVLK